MDVAQDAYDFAQDLSMIVPWTQHLLREVAMNFPRFFLRQLLVWFWPILTAKLLTIYKNTTPLQCGILVLSAWFNRHKLQKQEREPPQMIALMRGFRAFCEKVPKDDGRVSSAVSSIVPNSSAPYNLIQIFALDARIFLVVSPWDS